MQNIDIVIKTNNNILQLKKTFYSLATGITELKEKLTLIVVAGEKSRVISEYLIAIMDLFECKISYVTIDDYEKLTKKGGYISFMHEGDTIQGPGLERVFKEITSNKPADIVRISLYHESDSVFKKINRQFPVDREIIKIDDSFDCVILSLTGLFVKSSLIKSSLNEIFDDEFYELVAILSRIKIMKLLPININYLTNKKINLEKIYGTASELLEKNEDVIQKKKLYLNSIIFFCNHYNNSLSLSKKYRIYGKINRPNIVRNASYLNNVEKKIYLKDDDVNKEELKQQLSIDPVIRFNTDGSLEISGCLTAPYYLDGFELNVQEGITSHKLDVKSEKEEVLTKYFFKTNSKVIDSDTSFAFFINTCGETMFVNLSDCHFNINMIKGKIELKLIKEKNDNYIRLLTANVNSDLNVKKIKKRSICSRLISKIKRQIIK